VWPGNPTEVPVLRAPFPPACLLLIAVVAFAASVRAQERPSVLPAAPPLSAGRTGPPPVASEATALRSPSLLEFIRRTYDRPPGAANRAPATLPSQLPPVQELDSRAAPVTGAVPLPLSTVLWTESVLKEKVAPDAVLGTVLRSRGPALLYYGLFSLDGETREWLAAERPLLADLASRYAAPFVVASPGLRVRDAVVQPPGGDAARGAWEALVGHSTRDAAGFTRALLGRNDGRLAFFFGTMSQLTPGQLSVALRLDAPEAVRVDAARRLMDVFDRILLNWVVTDNVFWRPPLDPVLLLEGMRAGEDGRPILRGDRRLWRSVLSDARRAFEDGQGRGHPEPVDFPWLAEQVFTGDRAADRWRFDLVLFVSRRAAQDARWATIEAAPAIRAVQIYPALMLSLERAKLRDLPAFTAAARRAESIAAINDPLRRTDALAQFQGALVLVTRAARGTMPPQALATTISSLASVELNERGEYEGRLTTWLAGWLEAHLRDRPPLGVDLTTAGPLERAAITALAGRPDPSPRIVEWEGTRYRIDLAAAEATRVARHLGDDSRPYLSSARDLAAAAAAFSRAGLAADAVERESRTLENLAVHLGWSDDDSDAQDEYRTIRATLTRAVKTRDLRDVPRLAPSLLRLADATLARGLVELAYATALGDPGRMTIRAGEAALRHDFTSTVVGGRTADWRLPSIGSVRNRPWHVTGSLLGLDIALAEYTLVRRSARQPMRAPTLSSDQRRVIVETVALIDGTSLADQDRAALISAMRLGRDRVTAAHTPTDASTLADELRLSPSRRTLLSWTVTRDREALPDFLSPTELLWLGLSKAPVSPAWHAWGAPAAPRTGCLCLELRDRQPWEPLTGRLYSGALASAFSDLNLRLAELLEGLRMPAALLAPMLGAATLDLVESAAARDADDRQALLDVVRALRPSRVEEYLALLTGTGGPLVPVDTGDDR
jgi:hypothetical protein